MTSAALPTPIDPIRFKPWIAPSGQPVCTPDPKGDFILKADYDALNDKLTAATVELTAVKVKDEAIKQAADAPA